MISACTDPVTVMTAQEQETARQEARRQRSNGYCRVYDAIEALKNAQHMYRQTGQFEQAGHMESSLIILRMEAATLECLIQQEREQEQAVPA